MSRTSLEMQIFNWENWDEADVGILQFMGVKLLIPIGEFAKGKEFDYAIFNNLKSELVLGINDEEGNPLSEHEFDLYVQAKPKK